MPITVTIHDVVWTPRRVRLPDKCPKCKAGFRDGNNLREITMTEWAAVGKLVLRQGFVTDCADDIDGGSYLAVAYVCHTCGEVLVEGREDFA